MKTLVLGGGIGGMAVALKLNELGHEVDLVEKSDDWKAVGTGLTLSVLTLRALWDLGIGAEVMAQGYVHDGVDIYDQQGQLIRSVLTRRVINDETPPEGAILRPVLHQILSNKVLQTQIQVRLGDTVTAIDTDVKQGSDVVFASGISAHYDLVIGADGVFSTLRTLLMPEAGRPQYTGQACWRILFKRPENWTRGRMFQSESMKVGFNPCSPTHMYMYLMECVPKEQVWRDEADLPEIAKNLLHGFQDVLGDYIEQITADTPIIYRPLEGILVDGDWHRGSVLLIGDAVHATTPHLGSGAGLAVEDALVLANLLAQYGHDLEQVFKAFMHKRLSRAKYVVQTSGEIGRMEITGESMQARSVLLAQGFEKIAEAYV